MIVTQAEAVGEEVEWVVGSALAVVEFGGESGASPLNGAMCMMHETIKRLRMKQSNNYAPPVPVLQAAMQHHLLEVLVPPPLSATQMD